MRARVVKRKEDYLQTFSPHLATSALRNMILIRVLWRAVNSSLEPSAITNQAITFLWPTLRKSLKGTRRDLWY